MSFVLNTLQISIGVTRHDYIFITDEVFFFLYFYIIGKKDTSTDWVGGMNFKKDSL